MSNKRIVEVGDLCLKSFPCQHMVRMSDSKELVMLSGHTIARLYLQQGDPVPEHFQEYIPPLWGENHQKSV